MVHYDNGDVHVLLSGAWYTENAFWYSLSSFKVIFLQDFFFLPSGKVSNNSFLLEDHQFLFAPNPDVPKIVRMLWNITNLGLQNQLSKTTCLNFCINRFIGCYVLDDWIGKYSFVFFRRNRLSSKNVVSFHIHLYKFSFSMSVWSPFATKVSISSFILIVDYDNEKVCILLSGVGCTEKPKCPNFYFPRHSISQFFNTTFPTSSREVSIDSFLMLDLGPNLDCPKLLLTVTDLVFFQVYNAPELQTWFLPWRAQSTSFSSRRTIQ